MPALQYFAYGSNLNRADMRVRCPSAKPLSRATLRDWRLTFRGVADIEPAKGALVHGALWLLGESDVRALDRYEGAPSLYERRMVNVAAEGGSTRAMTYVMVDCTYRGLPSSWYLQRISEGYRDWALPREALMDAVDAAIDEYAASGATGLVRDGRKRLRAIRGED